MTAISEEEVRKVLKQIKIERPNSLCAARDADYIQKRRNCEEILRREFAAKGGIMEADMVVEHSSWLSTWYEQSDFLKISIEEFDIRKPKRNS